MTKTNFLGRSLCAAAALMALTQGASASDLFDAPAAFEGSVRISAADRAPTYPGSSVTVTGSGFAAGQTVWLERGNKVIVGPLQADAEGGFEAPLDIPADAAIGLHPVIAKTDAPDSAEVITLKISPKIALTGEDQFNITTAQLDGGLYQVAISEANNTLFVASAVGRPPVTESKLFKLDADTLEVLAEVTPAEAPDRGARDGGLYAVYGVAADDANGRVWVTNTRQNTVAVYSQDDLSLIKQFPDGAAAHPRDVLVDATRGRAYVSASSSGIEVYDLATLDHIETIAIASGVRRGTFTAMSLALDSTHGALYTVSLTSPEAVRIDLDTGETKLIPISGNAGGTGIDVAGDTGHIFVVSQGSDDLKILDQEGNELVDVAVGAGALNVVYDETLKLAFVANRASDSIAAVTLEGEIAANLYGGSFPNFIEEAADGTIYMVNKSKGTDDANGNMIWKIAPKS